MTDLAVVADELQAHLIKEFTFTVEDKETSDLMKGVATGLDMARKFTAGLPNSEDFMALFATTIGRRVFLPKVIRDNPKSKCEVVTHECEHVFQYAETGLEFCWFYLKDSVARAQFEADAYAAGIAVHCWLTGQTPASNIAWVVQNLVNSYHLLPEDAAYAEMAIKSHMASLASGIIMSKSARSAIAFLQAKYPGLKGTVPG